MFTELSLEKVLGGNLLIACQGEIFVEENKLHMFSWYPLDECVLLFADVI